MEEHPKAKGNNDEIAKNTADLLNKSLETAKLSK
jgi:hypothetical protein